MSIPAALGDSPPGNAPSRGSDSVGLRSSCSCFCNNRFLSSVSSFHPSACSALLWALSWALSHLHCAARGWTLAVPAPAVLCHTGTAATESHSWQEESRAEDGSTSHLESCIKAEAPIPPCKHLP